MDSYKDAEGTKTGDMMQRGNSTTRATLELMRAERQWKAEEPQSPGPGHLAGGCDLWQRHC